MPWRKTEKKREFVGELLGEWPEMRTEEVQAAVKKRFGSTIAAHSISAIRERQNVKIGPRGKVIYLHEEKSRPTVRRARRPVRASDGETSLRTLIQVVRKQMAKDRARRGHLQKSWAV